MTDVTMEKLRWRTVHKNNFASEMDFLETLLLDNGIPPENIAAFLKPTKKVIHNPLLMKNMDVAVRIFHNRITSGAKVFVKVDCDCDGVQPR